MEAEAALGSLSTQNKPAATAGLRSEHTGASSSPQTDTQAEQSHRTLSRPSSRQQHKSIECKVVFCCSFVCLTVQRAIKTSYTQQSVWQKKPIRRRKPKTIVVTDTSASCVYIYICRDFLCCVQLCTYRCIGKLQSKDSA